MRNLTSSLRPSRQSGLLILCLFLIVATGSAQRKSIKQYVHDIWTTANGFPQNGADDILQSRDGYLWFATQEGVARFDGVAFAVLNKANTPVLPNSWVIKILEDSLGGIWMRPQGIASGIVRYADGKATSYRVSEGLPSDQVICWEAGPGGKVWVGTQKGLGEWENGVWKRYTVAEGLPGDTVFAVSCDRAGSLWVSTTSGLARSAGGKFEKLTGRADLPDTILTRFNGLCNTYEDSRGTIWLASRGNLIAYRDGTFHRYGVKSGLPDSVIFAITEARDGAIWVGTRKGMAKFAGGKLTPVPVSSDPLVNNIREIIEDEEGSLWLRTRKGLARFAGGKVEFYQQSDGLTADFLQRILIDKEGSIWASSNGGGVDRFRDEKFVTYSTRTGLGADIVNAVFEDRSGTIWVGTNGGGASRIKDGVVTVIGTKEGLPGTTVRTLGEDPSGNVWLMTDNGPATYRDGRITPRLRPDQAKAVPQGLGLVRRSGTVLLNTPTRIFEVRNGGLVPYQPLDSLFAQRGGLLGLLETERDALWLLCDDSTFVFRDGKLTNVNRAWGVPALGVQAVDEDPDGTVWLGVFNEGVFRYRNGKLANVSPKQGLFDYNVYSFIEDASGYVWMSCNRGVYRVLKQDLEDVADGKKQSLACVVYGTADGMESQECNSTGVYPAWRTRDGRICFTTTKGISIVNPQEIRINTVPPPVVIDRFLVEGEIQPRGEVAAVSPGKSRFEFHYAGLSFVGADKIQYRYRLEGLDKGWIDAGNRREAYYTHLDPGEYTFRVIAANSDGIWNDTGEAVRFELEPHFYQTAWFLGLAGLFFLTSGPIFYSYRMRSMKRRREELEHQVQERTAELQKTLDNLKEMQNQLILSEKMASLGQLTAGIAHEIKNPLNFITNFAVLSHDLTQDLKKELIAERKRVDPTRAQEIEDLLNDLEQNVKKINEHGKRADSIVRGMLLHSRGKTGERQETDLNALLAEYTNLAYHGMRAQDQSFNVKIETEFDPAVGRVSVVPQDLSRAFLNIVNNACYAANDKRRTATNGFTPVVRVSARNLPTGVEIRIRDNGNGIPAAIREKIFNPFFTTKPAGAGTGLGLSLSYDIITQEHKGEIRVETEPGQYTEFIITIPRTTVNGGAA
jgi:signal transduction histidine kinase/ligand-binding sensor domain-containing protein